MTNSNETTSQMASPSPYNIPDTLDNKEQTFLALMAIEPDNNIRSVGRKLVDTGVYNNEKSVYCLFKNPVVREEYETIAKIKRENGIQLALKSQLLTDRELDRIAKVEPGKLEPYDERFIDRGFKAGPNDSSQVNVQVNVEQRRRDILARAQAIRASGGEIVVKEDT